MIPARYLIFIALLFNPLVCQSQIKGQIHPKEETSIDFEFYFPFEVFRDTSIYIGRDTFLNSWYSQHLFAMKEPVIFNDTSHREIYRFTWLRTFHNPVAIRIEKDEENYFLVWKVCDGAGGYDPGALKVNQQMRISEHDWIEFQSNLSKSKFWQEETNDSDNMGLDGSHWILEGKKDDEYHVVDRWTPKADSKYYQTCNYLIQLTNYRVRSREKY